MDNFSMNGFLDRVRVLPFAAADAAGELTLYDFARYDGASTAVAQVAHQQQQRFLDTPRQLQVQSRTLSTLLREADVRRADLIKIDVEGFEWEVLQGARDFLAAQQHLSLLVEWHTEFMPAARQDLMRAMLVDELRCRIERVETDGSTVPVDFDALRQMAHADLFAYRR
jgi:FkbM family methyltransferase